MLVKSLSALAVFAVAAVSASEPMPYKPLMKMSIHQMFGVHRRQSDGYSPTQSVCGQGATCADACGAGYETCASKDQTVHCYNPAAKQTCCPDNSGNSCDDGYYCTSDSASGTFCCPDGMDLVTCAAQYSVTGGLVSETAKPTSSSSSSSSTSSSAVITTSSSSTYAAMNSTTTATYTDTATTCTSTIGGSATYPASNSTTTTKKPSTVPSSTPSTVSISGASTYGAAGALSLLAAAAIAALL